MNILSSLLRLSPVTLGFTVICILVYLAMVFAGAHFANPHNQALIAWGGNYRPLTVNGQGWRLLTGLFVHGGLLHLVMNMIALADIGHVLEQKIGRRMLLVIFLLSGLFGGLCSLMWHPMSVGVGASGAIMGLAGALLVWLILPKLERGAEMERKVQVRALVMGLSLTLAVGAFSQRIDNAAHAGGLLAGVVLGAVVYVIDKLRSGALKRWAAAILLLLAGLLVLWQQLRLQSPDEYNFRKPLLEVALGFQQYGNVGLYIRQRAEIEQKDPNDFAQDQAGNSFSADAQRRQNRIWLEQAYLPAVASWDKCLATSQQWQNKRLLPAQKTLATQIFSYCSLRQRQYLLLRTYLRVPAPQPNLEMQRIVQQAHDLEEKMLPQLRLELQMHDEIQDQLGMSLTGKRKTPVHFGDGKK